jgi:hypothetical protein
MLCARTGHGLQVRIIPLVPAANRWIAMFNSRDLVNLLALTCGLPDVLDLVAGPPIRRDEMIKVRFQVSSVEQSEYDIACFLERGHMNQKPCVRGARFQFMVSLLRREAR